MTRFGFAAIVACVMLAGLPRAASADLTPEQKQAAEALIAQFSAKEFAARQQAVEKLVAMGPDVIPLLQKTLAETQDNEVKMRCDMVIKGIAAKQETLVQVVTLGEKIRLDPSKITLEFERAPLMEVVRAIAAQSGNAPLAVEGELRGLPVTLRVKDAPYWDAVGKLAAANGLTLEADWEKKRLALVKTEGTRLPSESIGPVFIQLHGAKRTQVMPAVPDPQVVDVVVCEFDLFWEERLPVFTQAVRIKRILSREEKDLLGTHVKGLEAPAVTASAPFGSRVRVTLPRQGEPVEGPVTIEGTARIAFGTGMKEFIIRDIMPAKKKTAAEGDTYVKLYVSHRWRDQATVALQARLLQDASMTSFVSRTRGYGVFLIDGRDTRYESAKTEFSERPASDGPGTAPVLKPGLSDCWISARFMDVGYAGDDFAVIYACPDKREEREFPFVLKDVPLP